MHLFTKNHFASGKIFRHRLGILCLMFLLLGMTSVMAQERTITGKVTAVENNEPLPGVNVILKGTTTGTVTDLDGNYRLNVPQNAQTLVFSFIGLTQKEVQIGAQTTINVEMEENAQQLSEIVITGQGGGIEKKRLSTTVESISSEQLEKVPTFQLDQILQSQLPNSQIKLNSGQPGTSSIIRTRGVVSASGATTPVIYIDGVRVDNTVGGELANGTGGATSSALADLPVESIERIEVIKGGAAATLYGADGANGVIQIFTKKGSKGDARFTLETQQGIMAGTRDFLQYDRTADVLFDPGHMQLYRLGVSGGSERTTYNFSGSVYDDEGFRVGNQQTRYNLRTTLQSTLADKLTYTGSFGFVGHQFTRDYNANSSFGSYGNLENGDYGNLDTLTSDELNDVREEVRSIVNNVDIFTQVRRFQTSHALEYKPIEKITLKGILGIDSRFSREREIFTNELDVLLGGSGVGQGTIDVFERNFRGITVDLNGTYRESFGDLSAIATVGFQGFNNSDEQVFYEGNDVVEGSRSINNAGSQNAEDYLLSVANYGYYGNLNLGFRDRLFAEVGLRVEQNSAFGDQVDPQLFPKVGLAYSLASEPFFQSLVSEDVVNEFKLRANYGIAGRFPTPFANQRTLDANPYLGTVSYTFSQAGDPTLRPERVTTQEAGFELSMFKSRVNVDLTYYNSVTRDALFDAPFPSSVGLGDQLRNLGEIKNTGLEIATTFDVIRTSTFDLRVNASYNTNQNEVLDNGGVAPFNLYGFTFLGVFVDEGQPVGFLRGDNPIFDEDGNLVDVEPNAALGQTTPATFGTVGLNLTYKNRLSLFISGDYQTGASLVNTNEVLRYILNTDFNRDLIPENAIGESFFDLAGVWVESADYFKVRNIALSYDMPARWFGNVLDGATIGFNVTNPLNFTEGNLDPEVTGANPGQNGLALGGYYYATESAPRSFIGSLKLRF
jgi:TonB-dependent SusC/RagA subfamily outer membrane receptor